ncbi:MAG: deoxyribodipyrimidine photo-lyase [Hydrogenophilaceae bacterium]|jgi:deoxyribodipyrimidine photo-lyase|nr:deoxyribodipyrimidine photo-lyase [Hydrogenophilaceae bacterium]
MSSPAPVLVWFRQDLRLGDNPAVAAAAASGRPLVFAYVLDDETPGRWRMGAASRWWLERSLRALAASLARLGGRLILRRGAALQEVQRLAAETGAAEVRWSRVYEPSAMAGDATLKAALEARGVSAEAAPGALLHEPGTLKTGQGGPFKVFTPFWRTARAHAARTPLPAPRALRAWDGAVSSERLEDWELSPTRPNWAAGFEIWRPGEAGAKAALDRFLEAAFSRYPEDRDRPGIAGTSRLSPHLHFGELSPAQAWAAAAAKAETTGADRALEKFLSELGWREFSHHLLFHWPDLPERNWKPAFDDFPWADDAAGFRAWTRGRTGYPIVDAGMRELWTTGWMHNRVRMIAASFLVKDLMIDWRRGAAWFWDTLVDADLANNSASWQWVAGSGADAAPYFRIFNPVAQGEAYDPDGAYVRRWLPELAGMPDELIHAPWMASDAVLARAGVRLGETYPHRIIDHAAARKRALAAFGAIKSSI